MREKKKNDPKEFDPHCPLDNATPSPEQYARLYGLAHRIFDAAPWTFLDESQVVAVDLDARTTMFVSVMGAAGTYFSVAVYPSFVVLDKVMGADRRSPYEGPDVLFSVPHYQLTFDSKTQLLPGEREALKAAGERFKNGKWPSALDFEPGYFPWRVGAQGIDILSTALEQLLAVIDEGVEIPHMRRSGKRFLTRYQKNGAWHTAVRQHKPEVNYRAVSLPEALIEQVCALPVRDICMEVSCFPLLTPIGKRSERSLCARQLVMIDSDSGKLLAMVPSLMPPEGKTWSDFDAIAPFLKQLAKIGFRPATMAAADGQTACWLYPLREMLGVRISNHFCKALLVFRRDMESFLFGR